MSKIFVDEKIVEEDLVEKAFVEELKLEGLIGQMDMIKSKDIFYMAI